MVQLKAWFSVTGCSRTHSAVTLGDWSDPLDPDVETQTIYKQLLQGRDKLRSVREKQSVNSLSLDAVQLLDTRGLCCNTGALQRLLLPDTKNKCQSLLAKTLQLLENSL